METTIKRRIEHLKLCVTCYNTQSDKDLKTELQEEIQSYNDYIAKQKEIFEDNIRYSKEQIKILKAKIKPLDKDIEEFDGKTEKALNEITQLEKRLLTE